MILRVGIPRQFEKVCPKCKGHGQDAALTICPRCDGAGVLPIKIPTTGGDGNGRA